MHVFVPHTAEGWRGSHSIVQTFLLVIGLPSAPMTSTQRSVPGAVHFVRADPQYGRHTPNMHVRPARQSPLCEHGRPSVAPPAVTHEVAPVASFVTSQV